MKIVSSLFRSVYSFLLPSVYFFALSTVSLFGQCDCSTPPVTCPTLQPTAPCATPSGNTYIHRFSVAGVHGAMTFIGNTLGLSKEECLNQPGENDSIGAFTTTDTAIAVPGWPTIAPNATGGPAGTTLLWQLNGSSAVLTIPAGSMILYAELIWSGSYGYFCDNPAVPPPRGVDVNCILTPADGPIFLTPPNGITVPVFADPATSMVSQNQADDVQLVYCGGNYVRSANITGLFTIPSLANPNGTYTVSGVPATISPFDETHNSAGWTLAIIYQDNTNPNVNNMTLFVANQQAQRPPPDEQFPPAEVSGFCAAPSETAGETARLLVSAIEADANKNGDSMRFGPTSPLTALDNLSGPNNIEDNFFACQINDDNGNLITTSGTFCTFNQDPATLMNIPNGRQGYDITNVDASATISPGQTSAFAQGTTVGDDYMINALGIQISVNAPVIVPTKKVNGQLSIVSAVGETVHFSLEINNTGNAGASNVFFRDILEPGLQLVPNTFKVNNVLVPNPNLVTGVPLGSIAIGQIVTIDFDVLIVSKPVSGLIFRNFGTTPFEFSACDQSEPFHASNDSNLVTILLIDIGPIGPTDFVGKIRKCPFLNRNEFSIEATFVPSESPNVLVYQVLKDGLVIATIPPNGPFVFKACLDSKKDAESFSIEAVFTNNLKSPPLNIRIVK